MDFNVLKRSKKAIEEAVFDDVKNAVYIAKKEVSIVFPKHYLEGKLGSLDERFNPLAMFAIVSGDNYAVLSIPSLMPLSPSSSTVIKLDGADYYKLSWLPGEVICPNTNLVKRKTLAFEIYDEFIAKGRVPPYFNNRDYTEIFYHLKDFCDVDLKADHAILSGYGAATARYPGDRTRTAREFYKVQADFLEMPIDRIPLRSVAYGADNTMARLDGSYLNEGMMSTLVNRSVEPQSIEQMIIS
ncbi:hypothetical protein [Vibrio phage BONAISHI]|nr:hypothetical protein [Vibrio phage BONAISHI]